jgi:catechol 2,3-dioxygenase-like lactoylglutathione lyase family enzyme
MAEWFARPVLHVADVQRSIDFYVKRLGFTESWRFDEDGLVFVAQVEREGCAIIFSSQWPDKMGKGLLFISLGPDITAVRTELENRGAPVKDGRWGYPLMVIDDPDGNQLFFNYPND